LRGLRGKSLMNFVWAGVALGVGFYDHHSFKIVPFLVALLILIEVLRGKLFRARAFWLGTAILVLTFVCMLPPYLVVIRQNPAFVSERLTSIMPTLFNPELKAGEVLAQRAMQLVKFFHVRGDSIAIYNLPGKPTLDPITGALFVLGLVASLLAFRSGSGPFLLVWFFATVVSGGLLTVDLRSHRFAAAFPAIFLMVGLFVQMLWDLLGRWTKGGVRKEVLLAPLCVLLAVAGLLNSNTFFNQQIKSPLVLAEFNNDQGMIADWVGRHAQGRYVELFANFDFYHPAHDFAWLAGYPRGERGVSFANIVPTQNYEKGTVFIVVTPYDLDAVSALFRHVYPKALMETRASPTPGFRYLVVELTADDVEQAAVSPDEGLFVTYYRGEPGAGAEKVATRKEPFVGFAGLQGLWGAAPIKELAGQPYWVQWNGEVYAGTPGGGDYAWSLWTNFGQASLAIDDQTVGAAREGEKVISTPLTEGWHRLTLTYVPQATEFRLMRLRWQPPGGSMSVIPQEVLRPPRSRE
jgi:hypothetical protein